MQQNPNVSPSIEDEIVLRVSIEQFLCQHGFTVITTMQRLEKRAA